jgi:hypothetical protein
MQSGLAMHTVKMRHENSLPSAALLLRAMQPSCTMYVALVCHNSQLTEQVIA